MFSYKSSAVKDADVIVPQTAPTSAQGKCCIHAMSMYRDNETSGRNADHSGTLNYDGDESDIDFEMIDDDMVSSIGSLERAAVLPPIEKIAKMVSPDSEASLSDASFDRSFDTDDAVNAMSDEDQQELTFRLSEQVFPRSLETFRFVNSGHLNLPASSNGEMLRVDAADPIEQLEESFSSTLEKTPRATNPSSPSPSILIPHGETVQNVVLHLLMINTSASVAKEVRAKFSAILSRQFVGDHRFNTMALPGLHSQIRKKGEPFTTVICPLTNFPSIGPQPTYEAFFDSGVKIVEQQLTFDEFIDLKGNYSLQDDGRSLSTMVCVIDMSNAPQAMPNADEIAEYLANWQVIVLSNATVEKPVIEVDTLLRSLSASLPGCFDFVGRPSSLSMHEFSSMNNDHALKRLFDNRPRRTTKWTLSSTWLTYIKALAVFFMLGFALLTSTGLLYSPTRSGGIVIMPEPSTLTQNKPPPVIKRLRTKMIVRTVTTTKTISAPSATPTSKAMMLSGRKDVISSPSMSSVQPVASARHVLVAATNAVQIWNAEANRAFGRVYDAASTAASNAAQVVNDEQHRVRKAATKAASKVLGSFSYETTYSFENAHNISAKSISQYFPSQKQLITLVQEYFKRVIELIATATQLTTQFLQTANEIIINDWIRLKHEVREKASFVSKKAGPKAKVVGQKATEGLAEAKIAINEGVKRVERGYRRVRNFASKAKRSRQYKQHHHHSHRPASWIQSLRDRAVDCYRHGYRDCQSRDWSPSTGLYKMKGKRRR